MFVRINTVYKRRSTGHVFVFRPQDEGLEIDWGAVDIEVVDQSQETSGPPDGEYSHGYRYARQLQTKLFITIVYEVLFLAV